MDIQAGVHKVEKDATNTMKMFKVHQRLAKERGMRERHENFDLYEFADVAKIKKDCEGLISCVNKYNNMPYIEKLC